MASMGKYLSLCLVAIFAVSTVLMSGSNAQTILTPAVPEFTLRYTDGSYDVATTQTTDPYTGQIITHQGYHVNLTVFEMVIQNQLQPINNLYYSIRVKGHYSTEWISFFDLSESLPLQDSSSQQTIIRMGTLSEEGLTLQGAHKSITIPSGGKEDIQVQALIGSIGRNASAPFVPYTFYGTESEWSNTQTVTVPTTNNPSPSPTVPEFPITASFVAVLAAVSLLLVIGKRKLTIINY
jgi:hypothetical protein